VNASPALDLWRRELRAGVGGQRVGDPGTWRLDALWRAACWEQSALEADRLGQHAAAARDRAEASQALAAGVDGGASA
jgi:hypothetical protein